ncbi:MAG: hypothetical protein QXU11_09005 [Thermoproteota archaeon]
MDDLKQEARRYAEALESIKQAKEMLKNIIIKYIIANSDLSKCTELAISESLGLPRSIVRSALLELVEEGVLDVREIGNVKPYILNEMGVGISLDWLKLNFTREEVNELLAAKEAEEPHGMMWMTWGTSGVVNGRNIIRYRGYAADICLKTLVRRFLSYTDEIGEKLRKAFDEQTLTELTLLFPEIGSFEKLMETPIFPATWVTKELQRIDKKHSAEDVKRILVESYERSLKDIIKKFKIIASILEEKGYEGLHEFFGGKKPIYIDYKVREGREPEYRFRDEYIWAATLALKEGCKIGEKIGADPSLLKEARMLADALDLALEKKYRGVRLEGLDLIDWAVKFLKH